MEKGLTYIVSGEMSYETIYCYTANEQTLMITIRTWWNVLIWNFNSQSQINKFHLQLAAQIRKSALVELKISIGHQRAE